MIAIAIASCISLLLIWLELGEIKKVLIDILKEMQNDA